jgi:hypothetical protein
MLAWAIGGVVSVLLIKQLARLLVHNTPALWPSATVRAFLLANATEAMLLFRRAISWLAQLDTASCLCLADCNTAWHHDKQGPQIGITSLAYPEQDLFTPTGVLTWNQSEPAASCRPFSKLLALPMVAISALAVTGPIPGILPIRWQRHFADSTAQSACRCSDDIEQVRHVVL